MNIIEITNLTKKIKGNTILNLINLSIEKGQTIGIIGRNGSGKSMLFKAICGFVIPTSGTIEVLGKKINKDVSFPEKTGFIIENPGFLPQYSGFKNLKILADIQGIITNDMIIKSLTDVGLDPYDKKAVKKYSLGMKQRLGIAQSIMENPELLILDEPTNGLDKDGVKIIHSLLKKIKENGTTILMASHNPLDIEILCDHVYEMDKGVLSLQH
ncbi:ABC transporter ATP-binding protein [Clostridium frigoris]|uniref:ABC transporter ATP-binding protein n=1 Tax=Clostridium frigoris TaxID=205327 RepID=A0ABS6BN84_9CLOT|nr:ABC transporter ATP-binding protein [Clostridium frigoris]MBU3158378.1 ABC transporter ATP-binding protein [Clostridium frigoris]